MERLIQYKVESNVSPALSSEVLEYTDCAPAEEFSGYVTKPSVGEASILEF